MKVKWEILKRREKSYIEVKYSTEMEDWEKEMKVPRVYVRLPIWWNVYFRRDIFDHILNTRTWIETESIKIPPIISHKRVKRLFEKLNRKYERKLRKIYNTRAYEYKDEIEMSSELKKHIAPEVIAGKMLSKKVEVEGGDYERFSVRYGYAPPPKQADVFYGEGRGFGKYTQYIKRCEAFKQALIYNDHNIRREYAERTEKTQEDPIQLNPLPE